MKIKKVILKRIKEYETIIIHGHIRPDGDCYGSQFGLKDIIKNTFPKKKVYAVGETSDYVSFVGEIDEKSLVEQAIKGYINGLNDDYSEYFTAEEWANFKENLEGEFFGIEIGRAHV